MNADTSKDPSRSQARGSMPMSLLLQAAARMFQRLEEIACNDAPIKAPLLGVLLVVDAIPGIRQGHCAELLTLDATTLGRYVDRLVGSGLLARSVPPEDRRSVTLRLTAEGRGVTAQCQVKLRDLEAEANARIGAEHWLELSRLLMQLLDVLDHPLSGAGSDDTDV